MSEKETSVTGNAPSKQWFIQELWEDLRPHLLRFLKDLIFSLLLWFGIWVFHLAGQLMPIGGWVDDLLKSMHAVGAATSFGIFIFLSLRNTWRVNKNSET